MELPLAGMQCTTLDRVVVALRRDDPRVVWFVTIRPDDTADPREDNVWVVLDDVTGREIARGTYPDELPPSTVLPPSGVAPKPEPPVPPNP